jgi:hypothetical protein
MARRVADELLSLALGSKRLRGRYERALATLDA